MEYFFEAFTDANEVPSGSEMSHGSDDGGEPNHCLFASCVPDPYLALSAWPAMRPKNWWAMSFGVSK